MVDSVIIVEQMIQVAINCNREANGSEVVTENHQFTQNEMSDNG
jgi:hypothetical protein